MVAFSETFRSLAHWNGYSVMVPSGFVGAAWFPLTFPVWVRREEALSQFDLLVWNTGICGLREYFIFLVLSWWATGPGLNQA